MIGICSADPRDMNVVDLYWGGSAFSCLCSFFSLGWQVVLRRETKQVELSSSLSIRNSSGRLAEKIKSIQLFGHLTQKNLVCSFPLLFVLISFSCFMYNIKHKSARVLSWNSKPPGSQTQKYLPKGQMSPLKTNFNIVPGGNKCDFFPLCRTDSACHSLVNIQNKTQISWSSEEVASANTKNSFRMKFFLSIEIPFLRFLSKVFYRYFQSLRSI